MITVAVPYYRCPTLLPRAVGSLLDQTYGALRVVVVADGDEVPDLPADPRLTVYQLPANRGTYFATAVALAASESGWFSIHAADDWSEPDRFERLMAVSDGVEAVFGGSVQHNGSIVSQRAVRFQRGGRRPRHVGSIATGVYRVEALHRLGWWSHPEFRVAYDSMMVNLVLRHLRWRHLADEFGYHRVVRGDSLTRSTATGLSSEYRAAASARRSQLWNAYASRPQRMQPDPAVAAEVLAHAAQLRRSLWEAVAA